MSNKQLTINVNQVKKEVNDLHQAELSYFGDPLENAAYNAQQFCTLCLRLCAANETFTFPGDFPNVFGLNLEPIHQTTCKTCWKMMEMITDFRMICLEAQKWAETFPGKGLDHDQDIDGWWLSEAGESIDQMHREIRRHRERIQREQLSDQQRMESEILPDPDAIKEETESVDSFQEDVATDFLEVISPNDCESQNDINDESTTNITLNDVMSYKCDKCLKYFDSKAGLSCHYLHCTGSESAQSKKRIHTCTICSSSFVSAKTLSYHMNKHTGMKPLECKNKCGKNFSTQMSRHAHEQSCGLNGLVCPICGLMLKNKNSLACHVSCVHGEAKFECEICGKKFRLKNYLIKHQRAHSDARNYPCTVCGKSFKSSTAAKVHLRIHTQEKPFSCSICEQAFTYKCLLKAHTERFHPSL